LSQAQKPSSARKPMITSSIPSPVGIGWIGRHECGMGSHPGKRHQAVTGPGEFRRSNRYACRVSR
jgi:hypothetical protein